MMVGLIAAEELKKGNITWETTVEATKEAELISSSKIWMKRGHTFTVYELVKSFMISSANDACYLTAQFLGGGTEAGFVVLMNNKAKELGMLNTHFGNSTGLPAPAGMKDNMSTPFDMLLLVRELLKYPEIVEISGRHGESVHNGTLKCELKNHNKLAIEYCEIDGLKTGFTRRAGFCLAATAEKGDTRLVAIVLGAQSPMLRNNFVAQVFNSYYDNYLGMGKLQKQNHSLNNHLSKAETILINNEGN
jgi:serine-type D-Ala-D-Ala carboxypeptidase (penicillin-binding protein 5/6)